MVLLCTLFVAGVIVIFAAAVMVAITALGICLKTIGAMGIAVAIIAILSCWLYDLYKDLYRRDRKARRY